MAKNSIARIQNVWTDIQPNFELWMECDDNALVLLEDEGILEGGEMAAIKRFPIDADGPRRQMAIYNTLKKKGVAKYFEFVMFLETEWPNIALNAKFKKLEKKHKVTRPGPEPLSLFMANIEPDSDGSYMKHYFEQASEPQNPEECYSGLLKSQQKGRAYIMNVMTFSNPKTRDREGSDVDFKNIVEMFTKLGYDVTKYTDLTAKEISDTITEFVGSFEDKDASSVVMLMSHGTSCDGKSYIKGTDGEEVEFGSIKTKFQKCRSLNDKPKMFFIQACRGPKLKEVVSADAEYEIEVGNRDLYTAFATTEGFLALRNRQKGSWFVQAIVEAFFSSAHKQSLLQMMTQVNNRVCENEGELGDGKILAQTPVAQTSLRKDVYFCPNYPKQ